MTDGDWRDKDAHRPRRVDGRTESNGVIVDGAGNEERRALDGSHTLAGLECAGRRLAQPRAQLVVPARNPDERSSRSSEVGDEPCFAPGLDP
jgi:hypothetical protein